MEKNWEELKKEAKQLSKDLSIMIGEQSDIVLKLNEKLTLIGRLNGQIGSWSSARAIIMEYLFREVYFFCSSSTIQTDKLEISKETANWMLVGLFEGLKADIREANWMLNQLRNAAPWDG